MFLQVEQTPKVRRNESFRIFLLPCRKLKLQDKEQYKSRMAPGKARQGKGVNASHVEKRVD
jgi:hypothetical protein